MTASRAKASQTVRLRLRSSLAAVAAPSLTRRCRIPRAVRKTQQLTTMGLPGKLQPLMPERLAEFLEKNY